METRELVNAVMKNHLQHDPNRGAGTRNLCQQKLQTFVDWLGDREFTKNVVTQFLFETEQEGLSPSTRNGYLSAITKSRPAMGHDDACREEIRRGFLATPQTADL